MAMSVLGTGLHEAGHNEVALSVREAELSIKRRLGVTENSILVAQNNLACTYKALQRFDEALRMKQDVYAGRLKLNGIQHEESLLAANNYANSLLDVDRFEEARSLLRKTMPVAQRVLGDSNGTTLRMRTNYGRALCSDDDATLDDLRKAVTTIEDTERTAQRVLGGAHPMTGWIGESLRCARDALRARETPSPPPGEA